MPQQWNSTATKKSSTHDKFSATPSISWATILNREFDLSPISLFDTNVAPAKVYFGAPMTTYGSPVYEAAIAFLNARWPQGENCCTRWPVPNNISYGFRLIDSMVRGIHASLRSR
jgi:hypothetical protein